MVRGRLDNNNGMNGADLEIHCVSSWNLLQKFKELKKETENFVGDNDRDYWHRYGQEYLEILEETYKCMSHLEALYSGLYKRSEDLYNRCCYGAYYENGVKLEYKYPAGIDIIHQQSYKRNRK